MPQKKPYVPKTKGCRECSQRRIDCDRTEPACRKCSAKGIECSGLHLRHRFLGVLAKGKRAGKGARDAFGSGGDEGDDQVASRPDPSPECARPLRWRPHQGPDRVPGRKTSKHKKPSKPSPEPQLAPNQDADNSQTLMPWSTQQPSPSPCPAPTHHSLPPWQRFFLHHFADQIANEMVVIDGPHNGWRHLILPLALTDPTLMDAVLAVSAFHHALSTSNLDALHTETYATHGNGFADAEPRGLYTRAISRLNACRFGEGDLRSRHMVLLTILVLLTSAMVTGDSDFVILCRLLRAAVEAMGGENAIGEGELGGFITRQTHKLLTYAAPLLSEESGLATMSSPSRRLEALDCLNHCIRQHPEHEQPISLVADLIHQAQDIYLAQFHADDQHHHHHHHQQQQQHHHHHHHLGHQQQQPLASVFRVQRFIDTLDTFPLDSPGEQVLVWASFMAASACVLDEHKAFFEGYLFQHYVRSGFWNLVKGLEHLRLIWARGPGERWTRLLPQAGIFIM